MITSLIAGMLAAGSALPNYTLPPPKPARSARCTADCASRYRIPAASDDGPTLKARALADDGSKCNVVGSKLCLTKPRTWYRARY